MNIDMSLRELVMMYQLLAKLELEILDRYEQRGGANDPATWDEDRFIFDQRKKLNKILSFYELQLVLKKNRFIICSCGFSAKSHLLLLKHIVDTHQPNMKLAMEFMYNLYPPQLILDAPEAKFSGQGIYTSCPMCHAWVATTPDNRMICHPSRIGSKEDCLGSWKTVESCWPTKEEGQ